MIVNIEKQNDGTYIAYNKSGDDVALIGTGNTVSEAKDDFFNSVQETIEACQDNGIKIPAPLQEEVTFKFDLSSLFEYYSVLNVSAFARYLGINDTLMRQYKKGNTYISDSQLRKIENGIHALGQEFSNLRLV